MEEAHTWPGLRAHLRADLFRYHGRVSAGCLVSSLLREPGFKFTFWLRVCRFLHGIALAKLGPYWVARWLFGHYRFKYGLHIDWDTRLGPGFYLCHVGGIVVNRRVIIGKNCNLSHGVTLGSTSRGERQGTPVVGDNVYLGPGAKIIGAVRLGDRAAIGANAVVTADVPDDGVAVGIPARVVSDKGSAGYVNQTEWE